VVASLKGRHTVADLSNFGNLVAHCYRIFAAEELGPEGAFVELEVSAAYACGLSLKLH